MQDDLNIPPFLKRAQDFVAKGKAAQAAVDKIIDDAKPKLAAPEPKATAAAAKDFADKKKTEKLATAQTAKQKAEAWKEPLRAKVKAVTKVPKKAGKVVEKALRERDALAAKAKAISAANGKTPAKPKAAKKGRYDWTAAEEAAAKGTVPATPDFSASTHKCYRPRLAEIEKLVKKGDVKALKAMKETDFRKDGSPLIMNRYRKLAITALEAKRAR